MNQFDLGGKTAVVTGGNSGIGFAIARALAQAGATVVVANRTEASGARAAQVIAAEGGRADAVRLDVNSLASVRDMTGEVVRRYGAIDILVNSAGVLVRKPAECIEEDDWDRMLDCNLKGLFFCCQQVGRTMLERGQGKIINIASVLCQIGQQDLAVYAISKAGVAHLTKVLGMEWAGRGVRVNGIAPTLAITEINRAYFDANQDVLQRFVDATPVGRVSYPQDYAGAAVFLASAASDYMVGQTLLVDGGRSIP